MKYSTSASLLNAVLLWILFDFINLTVYGLYACKDKKYFFKTTAQFFAFWGKFGRIFKTTSSALILRCIKGKHPVFNALKHIKNNTWYKLRLVCSHRFLFFLLKVIRSYPRLHFFWILWSSNFVTRKNIWLKVAENVDSVFLFHRRSL